LPLRQEELSINGGAMEARLYAEDPAKGFLPSVGPVDTFKVLAPARIEAAVEKGDLVSPFYDPMIAKIVVHGLNRYEACKKLRMACGKTQVAGVNTNAGFLERLVSHRSFFEEDIDTGFIARHGDDLELPNQLHEALLDDAAILLLGMNLNLTGRWYGPSIEHSYYDGFGSEPWRQNFGFRLNADWPHIIPMNVNGETIRRELPDDFLAKHIEGVPRADGGVVFRKGEALVVRNRWAGGSHHHAHDGDILSPMPGKIIAVEVSEGQAVTKGQKLLTLEAMKMEHTLVAPFDGTVAELSAVAGAQVQVEALLARIEASA
jgi:3-methylcrotonyl-CoA carboxylase alpha subunit